jgi:hypothetical protein
MNQSIDSEPTIQPVYFPPETTDFQVGVIKTESSDAHAVVSGSFEGHEVYDRMVRLQLLGRISLPLFDARVNAAKKHAMANIQFQAEGSYGYSTPMDEAARAGL